MRLVSAWLSSAGILPKHLFGLVRSGFLDVTHTGEGNDALVGGKRGRWKELKTKPSLRLVVWTEAKVRTEGGRETEWEHGRESVGRTDKKEGEIIF